MRGELDFEQSLRRRVGTLKGAPESILQQVREKLPLMPGLIETIKTLQQHGWKTAIASGGFTYFADYLKSLLNLDFAASNQFEIIDGTLTGNVKGLSLIHILSEKRHYSNLKYGYARGYEAYQYVENIRRYMNSIVNYHRVQENQATATE